MIIFVLFFLQSCKHDWTIKDSLILFSKEHCIIDEFKFFNCEFLQNPLLSYLLSNCQVDIVHQISLILIMTD